MGVVKQVKDQLGSLSPQSGGVPGGDLLKKGGDSLKDMKPKFRVAWREHLGELTYESDIQPCRW